MTSSSDIPVNTAMTVGALGAQRSLVLSVPRYKLAAASYGNVVYFAGGWYVSFCFYIVQQERQM